MYDPVHGVLEKRSKLAVTLAPSARSRVITCLQYKAWFNKTTHTPELLVGVQSNVVQIYK